ncbi:MAG: hypothetical protein JSS09_01375 [Verrucomicrobia bacterium]|nr:hypothetical protein [Verrucomicrobiota bacterium]
MQVSKVITVLGVLLCVTGFAEKKMIYESVTKGEVIKAFWDLVEKEDKIDIKVVKQEKNISMKCLSDFSLISYVEKVGNDKEFSIEKSGPCLIVRRSEKGKDKMLSHKINKMPWIQEFTLGFQGFIKDKKQTCEFCIVYPKDLALHEMIATKEGEEELEIGGKKYTTQKVKITLAGIKKNFWKAYAWFDKKTAVLVQYKANEGPRTPYTETSLIEVMQ